MGGCQNYGPFLGTLNNRYYNKDPKRDPNSDNHPYIETIIRNPKKVGLFGYLEGRGT